MKSWHRLSRRPWASIAKSPNVGSVSPTKVEVTFCFTCQTRVHVKLGAASNAEGERVAVIIIDGAVAKNFSVH
jgi:hypothetical protein